MTALRVAVSFLLILMLPATSFAGLVFGPYLQSPSEETLIVCAYVETGDKVAVRLTEASGEKKTVPAEGTQPACAKIDGLKPDAGARYELLLNGESVTEPTVLAPFAASEAGLTMAIYGDTRAGDDSFDLAHRQIVDSLTKTALVDAIFHTGDFVEQGENLDLWTNFFRIEKPSLLTAPIFPAIGRSDQPGNLMRSLFPMLADSPWYSVTRGDVHLIVTKVWQSASQPKDEVGPDGAQARWLRADLAKAKNAGARYIFVVVHEPAKDIEGNHPPAIRDVFMPLFESFGVTAVFSGAHFFSHFENGGVHYFTNGGGGASLDLREPPGGAFRYFSAIHHFLLLEAGRAGARVRAVNAYGEDFYTVDLDDSPSAQKSQDSPTYVKSYDGGPNSVAMTVFHLPGCGDCEQFQQELPAIAQRTSVTIVATFRSLENPDNRAILASLTDQESPTPIVALGKEVYVGSEQIDTLLESEIADSAAQIGSGGNSGPRTAILIAVFTAGAILLLSLIAVALRKRAGR
jgi:hypothetical protein